MSCLSLNKLLPGRKTWRIFSCKIQSKLSKLPKSKVIKKPKYTMKKSSKRKITWPTFGILQRKKFKHKKPSKTLPAYTHYSQNIPSPVYIDQLFVEPAVSVVKSHILNSTLSLKNNLPLQSPLATEANGESSSRGKKVVKYFGEMEAKSREEEGRGVGGENIHIHGADDMWESVVMASSQMDGINERAEEFISKFRAEMQQQERFAPHL